MSEESICSCLIDLDGVDHHVTGSNSATHGRALRPRGYSQLQLRWSSSRVNWSLGAETPSRCAIVGSRPAGIRQPYARSPGASVVIRGDPMKAHQ
jgi:hypothetical protein